MIALSIRWLNATLPPRWLAILIAGAAGLVGLEWAFMWRLKEQYGALPYDWSAVKTPRAWLAMSLGTWAIWRAYLLNPAYQSRYREWLRTTPWAAGDKLPLGRVEFASQDALWIAIAALACWHPSISWQIPLAFLVPYCGLLTLVNYHAKQYVQSGLACGLMAMLPLSLLAPAYPWMPLILGIAALTATTWGWQRTLHSFPWENSPSQTFRYDITQSQEGDGAAAWWPLVHPWRGQLIEPLINRRELLSAAAFAGWLAATAAATIDAFEAFDAARFHRSPVDVVRIGLPLVGALVGAFAGGVRLYRYVCWCAWPISLNGRRKINRLIIPGYDIVFLAPLATFTVGLTLPQIMLPLGTPTTATAFITMFSIVLAAAGIGPTLAEWSLTGEYRLMQHTPVDKHRTRRGAAT